MAVRACGALDASYMAAAEYAHLAEASLEDLEDSLPKQALVELSGFVLSRQM
jgi:geranylgeranyl pyrophosphate synthase